MVAKIKKTKFCQILPHLNSWVQDTPFEQFLMSNLYFSGIAWIDKLCIILSKKCVSIFNRGIGKRQFLPFHGNSCKVGKNGSSVTRKNLQPFYKKCI